MQKSDSKCTSQNNLFDLAGTHCLWSESEQWNPFEIIEGSLNTEGDDLTLPAHFWEQSDVPSHWNIHWTDAAAYGGGLKLDDPVFGSNWAKYSGAHAWFDCNPGLPFECGGHNCLGMKSTEGHAPAAAATAQPGPLPLSVLEPPTPTPSEIDAFQSHWKMCFIRCDVKIRPAQSGGSGSRAWPGHGRRNRPQEAAGNQLWGDTDIAGRSTGGAEKSCAVYRTHGHGTEIGRTPVTDNFVTETHLGSADTTVPAPGMRSLDVGNNCWRHWGRS